VCERIPYLILPVRQLSREPSGNTPGPSPSEPSAEAPRASHQAIRRARLHPNHPPKRHERAIGQYAGPVSIRTIRRSAASEPSGNTPGPSRFEPSTEAIHKRAVRQAAGPASNHPSGTPRTIRRRDTQAIRRASRCRGAVCDPALKPQPAGAADIEPNPLDYSL